MREPSNEKLALLVLLSATAFAGQAYGRGYNYEYSAMAKGFAIMAFYEAHSPAIDSVHDRLRAINRIGEKAVDADEMALQLRAVEKDASTNVQGWCGYEIFVSQRCRDAPRGSDRRCSP